MATEFEIVFRDEAADDGAVGAPIDTAGVGAPVGGHAPAGDTSKVSPDGPKSNHFRELTTAIKSLTKRITGKSDDRQPDSHIPKPRLGPPADDREKDEKKKRGEFSFANLLADRLLKFIGVPTKPRQKLLGAVGLGRTSRQQGPAETIQSKLQAMVDRITKQSKPEPRPQPQSTLAQRTIQRVRDSRVGQVVARTVRRVRESRAGPFVSQAAQRVRDSRAGQFVASGPRRLRESRVGQAISGGAQRARAVASQAARGISESRIGQAVGRSVRGVLDSRAGKFVSRQVGRVTGRGGITVAPAVKRRLGSAASGFRTAGASRVGATVARAGAAIGAVAAPVAIVTAALVGMAVAVKVASGLFSRIADNLEDVSGPIAAARAQNRARREISRIERARRIGPQVATVVSAQGRFDDAFDDLKTAFLEELVKLAPLVEAGIDIATAVLKIVIAFKEAVDILIAFVTGNWASIPQEMREANAAKLAAAQALLDIFRTNQAGGAGVVDPDILLLLGNAIRGPNPVPPNPVP